MTAGIGGKKRLAFDSPRQLAKWLAQTDAGQKILGEIEAERCEQCKNQKPAVLVVLHADGFVEAFSEGAAVKIVQRLAANTPALGRAVDEYLDESLPRRFADIHWPNKLAAVAKVERRTVREEYERRKSLEFLRELREWREWAESLGVVKEAAKGKHDGTKRDD